MIYSSNNTQDKYHPLARISRLLFSTTVRVCMIQMPSDASITEKDLDEIFPKPPYSIFVLCASVVLEKIGSGHMLRPIRVYRPSGFEGRKGRVEDKAPTY